jgi:hypothetical protein
MARRLKALFMLVILGLVLPAAGSPQRFCTRTQSFMEHDCCSQNKDCSHCPDEKAPADPSCVAAAKVVPDGIHPDHQPSLPTLFAVLLPPFSLPEPVEMGVASHPGSPSRDRAPPGDSARLYLTHRSLLI